jgi:hypothetical protein
VGQRLHQDASEKLPAKSYTYKGVFMTRCGDQQEDVFVLMGDRSLTPAADLPADGFLSEAFAKHVGRKVTTRGTSSPGEPRPVFNVRIVETVNDVCAPPEQHQ